MVEETSFGGPYRSPRAADRDSQESPRDTAAARGRPTQRSVVNAGEKFDIVIFARELTILKNTFETCLAFSIAVGQAESIEDARQAHRSVQGLVGEETALQDMAAAL